MHNSANPPLRVPIGRETVLGSERDGSKFGQAGEERSIFVSKRRYDSRYKFGLLIPSAIKTSTS